MKSERKADERDLAGKDPVDVLRRILKISRDDAEKVRDEAAEAAKRSDGKS